MVDDWHKYIKKILDTEIITAVYYFFWNIMTT